MQDELEKFIKKNRELFDDKTPDQSVWSKIEEQIAGDKKKKQINFPLIWKAAAVFFFGLSAYLLFQLQNVDTTPPQAYFSTENIMKEFQETEAFYISEISEKRAHIEAIDHVDPDLVSSFETDIQKLDSMYNELKEELAKNSNEQVFNALVQNLQIRIEILNQQLNILENVKKSESDEKVNI